MSPCHPAPRGPASSPRPTRSKPPEEAPPPTACMTSQRVTVRPPLLPILNRHWLPSQQPVGGLLCQHRGCCHAAVAEPQLLDDVSPWSEGGAHRCSDGADVVLPAWRLLEGGDKLSLKRRRKMSPDGGEHSRRTYRDATRPPSCCMGSQWTRALPAAAEWSSCIL